MVEKCEDTKRVMKNKTEHRWMTDNTMAKKKIKEQTVIDKTLQKTIDWATRTPLKPGGVGRTQSPRDCKQLCYFLMTRTSCDIEIVLSTSICVNNTNNINKTWNLYKTNGCKDEHDFLHGNRSWDHKIGLKMWKHVICQHEPH
jgi:hypothetical protein